MGNLVISPWQLVVDKHRLDGGGFGADLACGSWELVYDRDQWEYGMVYLHIWWIFMGK